MDRKELMEYFPDLSKEEINDILAAYRRHKARERAKKCKVIKPKGQAAEYVRELYGD